MSLTQPGPTRLAALDAGERVRVAGQHGEPQVGAEPLRRPSAPSPSARGRRSACATAAGDGAEVVVLDDEHVGAVEHGAQLARARRHRAPRRDGFCPRGVTTTARAPARCGGGERVREHAARRPPPPAPGRRPSARTRSSTPGKPGSSTAIASPRREVGGEHALDAVERAVDHAQARRVDAVGGERRAGDAAQLGQTGSLAVQARRRRRARAARRARRAAGRGRGCRSARSRTPVGHAAAGEARRSGGRSATRVPLRGRETTMPAPPQVGERGRDGGRAHARGWPPARAPRAAARRAPAARRRSPPRTLRRDLTCGRARADTVPTQIANCTRTDARADDTPAPQLRRVPKRGAHDRETIDAILDEALICHLGFVHDGHPFVIPTLHARVGDEV